MVHAAEPPPPPRSGGGALGPVVRVVRRLLVGVLVGGGTIFGAKPVRDQHWSIPPTMVVDHHDQDVDGDPDDLASERLPACA